MAKQGRQRLWVSILVFCVGLSAGSAALAATLKVGDFPPPRLTSDVNLRAYRGKVVIVSFWASWCPPCRQELPVLASIQKQATRHQLVVFAVDWRQNYRTFWQIRSVLRDLHLTLLSDPYGTIGYEYDVNSIPHMVIIGRNGRIAGIRIGYGKDEIPGLVKQINSLLMQPSVPPKKRAQRASHSG